MRFGITMFPTDQAMAPQDLASEVEARGFEALAFPEHTHIPTSRRTPFPGGEPIPDYYKRTHDPLIALTAAAMATERIELWTGIALIAQREPIVTAKALASLDVLSGGRCVLGIGYGWNADELEHHGVSFKDRREVVRERILAMRALWTQETASFDGEHVRFSGSWAWPKPLQAHGPKVMLGAAPGPKTFDHLAEFCDGWMPIAGTTSLSEALPQLKEALEARGRKLDEMELTVFGGRPDPERIKHYEDLGVSRMFLWVPPADRDEVLPALDAYAALL